MDNLLRGLAALEDHLGDLLEVHLEVAVVGELHRRIDHLLLGLVHLLHHGVGHGPQVLNDLGVEIAAALVVELLALDELAEALADGAGHIGHELGHLIVLLHGLLLVLAALLLGGFGEECVGGVGAIAGA